MEQTATLFPTCAQGADASPRRPLSLTIHPTGRLDLRSHSDSIDEAAGVSVELADDIAAAFGASEAAGLLFLATSAIGVSLPPSLAFGRSIAVGFLHALCSLDERVTTSGDVGRLRPQAGWLTEIADAAPLIHGGEYLDESVVAQAFARLAQHVAGRMEAEGLDIAAFLERAGGGWHAVGRVWFHLAENKDDLSRPFAFLATYTPVSGRERAGHQREVSHWHRPLGSALEELAGQPESLSRLLAPVRRAADRSAFVRHLMESGELFHPLAWTAEEAGRLLEEGEKLDGTGIMLRLPKQWQGRRPAAPRVEVRIGDKAELGTGALLDFKVDLALDGERLTERERQAILKGTRRLALLRGKWVEVDPAQLKATLEHWAERSDGAGLGFAEGLQMLADANADVDVRAGDWLEEVLGRLHDPRRAKPGRVSRRVRATLRPYQREGVAWLQLLFDLGLGGCLADDMGLGKTLQVIALIAGLKKGSAGATSLIVVPASLLGNWRAELERFAPSLSVAVAHRSVSADLDEVARIAGEVDVVLTTYGTLPRMPSLLEHDYAVGVLDEAQAIKNPSTRQAKTVKKIRARCRLALTGTPIENRLGDLWSMYDFVSPGLLGSAKSFGDFVARLSKNGDYGPLRRLIRPYLLRRLKTDKHVVADLPEKTEVDVYCPLTKKQAALYEEAVNALAEALERPIKGDRRGLIFAFLTRFKQICNHPSHWLGDGHWAPDDSGKLRRLANLADAVATRQEKLLVFTQYREATGPIADSLETKFGRPGLVLHGGVPVKKRRGLVETFQADDGPPFFVLSLKAGGTGLNLTAANHVVHFDRWWNPAVENQATDRAYRIGQQRNVLVHRFICPGTLEERIDRMLTTKRALSDEVLAPSNERSLTELSNEELYELVRLDLSAVVSEES